MGADPRLVGSCPHRAHHHRCGGGRWEQEEEHRYHCDHIGNDRGADHHQVADHHQATNDHESADDQDPRNHGCADHQPAHDGRTDHRPTDYQSADDWAATFRRPRGVVRRPNEPLRVQLLSTWEFHLSARPRHVQLLQLHRQLLEREGLHGGVSGYDLQHVGRPPRCVLRSRRRKPAGVERSLDCSVCRESQDSFLVAMARSPRRCSYNGSSPSTCLQPASGRIMTCRGSPGHVRHSVR
jgi:hypothetical protein